MRVCPPPTSALRAAPYAPCSTIHRTVRFVVRTYAMGKGRRLDAVQTTLELEGEPFDSIRFDSRDIAAGRSSRDWGKMHRCKMQRSEPYRCTLQHPLMSI